MSLTRKSRPARILVVDDDPGLLRLLTIRLRSEKYEVEPVASAATALDSAVLFRPDLVISDLRMAEMDGIGLLKELQRRWPGLSVILLTAHGTIPDAVRATQSGAFAFLTKPLEKDHLLAEVRRALRTSGFIDASEEWQTEFLTRNSHLSDLLAKARMVANTDTTVLLTGESGTGKEPLARAIHNFSARRDAAFVGMDCGLLAPETGADRLAAALRDADGGTVFLRNVDALSELLQLSLAQALPGVPLPSDAEGRPAKPPVRVVVTSERRLDELVAAQQFSEGLFDRLNGLHLDLLPLSKRREDIPLLVARFLDEIAAESGQNRRSMSPQAMEVLASASWPGNVRELRQVVREVASLAVGAVVSPELVKQAMGQTTRMPSFDEARDEFTRGYLTQLLQITKGNVSQAARLAKRNRTDFYKLLTRHSVSPDDFKE
jgi:two-component system response regulator GlrR